MTKHADYMRQYRKGMTEAQRARVKESQKEWREKNLTYVRDKYTKDYEVLKRRAVKYKGGKCSRCGKTFPLACYDFHHTNPSNKAHSICRLISNMAKWSRIEAELDKCILVCANCHRIIEHGDGQ